MTEKKTKRKRVQRAQRVQPSKDKRSIVAEQVEKRDRSIEPETEEIVGPDLNTITSDRLIPSGSTRVNCACSDNKDGAFAMGTIVTLPGKSGSGKTVFTLTILTECAIDPRFDNYDLCIDDAEQALQGFNLPYLFPPLAKRLMAPAYNKNNEPVYSNTIQDFKANVLNMCHSGKPFIYVLDSLDSLSSDEEVEREYKAALAHAKSPEEKQELKGSYKAEKAKGIGEALRMINGLIKKSDSALFIIQQTRQNLKPGFGQRGWVTSGGEAPYFYSFHQVFLAPMKSHTDEARGVKHKIGGKTKVEVIKNKLTGKKRNTEIDIYEDYGIDDLTGCIEFLCTTKEWKKNKAWIEHPFTNDDKKIQISDLIEYIEENNLENDVKKLVGEVWVDIEDQMKLNRKRKY